MTKKMRKTTETIDDYIRALQNEYEGLKEYGEFIESYNRIMGDMKNLEAQKNEVEGMQSQLKKLESSVSAEHGRSLQILKEKYNNLQNDIKRAGEII